MIDVGKLGYYSGFSFNFESGNWREKVK